MNVIISTISRTDTRDESLEGSITNPTSDNKLSTLLRLVNAPYLLLNNKR
jgi:hypothetical protein